VLVESYIHQNHCPNFSWVRTGKDGNIIGRGQGSGKRLIMLHAITKDGPLMFQSDGDYTEPVTDFEFGKGKQKDICFTKEEGDTAELLWTASQHTGDCAPPHLLV